MKQGSTLFLKGVIIVIGLVVLGLCIYILSKLAFEIGGYYRPLLIGICIPAIPFFIGLSEAFKLLRYIDENKAFSSLSIRALKNIKRCALTIAALYAAGMPYIFYVADKDDAPGVTALGFIIIGASVVVAVFGALLQKLLQTGMEIQSENELTV